MASRLRWTTTDDQTGQATLFDDVVERHVGRGEFRGLEFFHVESRQLINRIPSSAPLPFEYTINAYRGCSHRCSYCFARPTHEYLGFNMAEDFDSKIVVKTNAVELAAAETEPRRWAGHPIAMGTNTDPYQRAEGKYRLTRGIVEVLAERRNPFSILTKSSLVVRDLDLLAEAATQMRITVDFSIGTLDEETWKLSEPGTPHPRQRIEAIRKLTAAGVPSGILMAPVLPGLSDRIDQLEAVVVAGLDAGARFISPMYLHLRGSLLPHYLAWLTDVRPDLVERHERAYRRSRNAPVEASRWLSTRVRDLVEQHGGIRRQRIPRQQMVESPEVPATRQLNLDI